MCPLSYTCPPCKESLPEDEFRIALPRWTVCTNCGEPNPNANNKAAIREAVKDMPMWIIAG